MLYFKEGRVNFKSLCGAPLLNGASAQYLYDAGFGDFENSLLYVQISAWTGLFPKVFQLNPVDSSLETLPDFTCSSESP